MLTARRAAASYEKLARYLLVLSGPNRNAPGKAPDLSGNWELTLPAGAKFRSPIERVSENTYRIPSLQSLSGVYELKGHKLVVTVPTDQRLTEYIWKVENANTLTLIQAPPTSKIGSDYKGATLIRLP